MYSSYIVYCSGGSRVMHFLQVKYPKFKHSTRFTRF